MTKKLQELFGFDQLDDAQDPPAIENMTVEETRHAIVNIDVNYVLTTILYRVNFYNNLTTRRFK